MSNILTNNINPRSGNKITIGGVNDTVSIAGTITYEDVTSVDSIGIITARGGLDVGVGGTVLTSTTSGNIGIGTNLPVAVLTTMPTAGFSTADVSDLSGVGLFLRSANGIEGDGNFGSALAWSRPTDPERFKTAIAPVQEGADIDLQGLAFFTADSASAIVSPEERVRIDSSGRLLVGTDSSIETNSVIQAVSASNSTVIIGNTNTSASGEVVINLAPSNSITGGQIKCIASEDFSTGANRTASLELNTRNNGNFNTSVRIASGGDVVLKPENVASVSGANSNYLGFRVTQTNNQSALLGTIRGQGKSAWGGDLVFYSKAANSTPNDTVTEQMRLRSDGILFAYGSYNNTTANAANAYFGSGSDIGRSTSSRKYKTSIEDIEDSYSDALLGCRPVWYRSTCAADNPDYGYWGFIAEEVAEIDPRLVHWKTVDIDCDENGSRVETPCDPEPESVAYDRFVPHLLNLIKRQQQAIETLEARVAALEGN